MELHHSVSLLVCVELAAKHSIKAFKLGVAFGSVLWASMWCNMVEHVVKCIESREVSRMLSFN